MYQSIYFIDKSSNTFSDNLASFGLAFVLNSLAAGRAKIHLEDRGSSFAVVCEPAIEREWVESSSFFAGAPFLVTLDRRTGQKAIKGTTLNPSDLGEFDGDTAADYEAEKRNNAEFFEWLKGLTPDQRRDAVRGVLVAPVSRHRDWEIFRAVNPAALQGYNGVIAEWWRGRTAFAELLNVLLRMAAQTPNDLEEAETTWTRVCRERGWERPKGVKALQLLNPAQGKGVNARKAAWSAPGNLSAFWLLECLKVFGLFQAGLTRIVANPKDPRNAKDRKTYVLMPRQLEWGRHQEVMKDFRQAMAGSATAVKLDILAALRYTQAFLKHYEGARAEDLGLSLFGQRPADLVDGMQMAFYKNLGNAIATMNIAAINLPRWVVARDPDDLARLQTALEEHADIVRGLDETRGEQYELLVHYRDFMSGNDLEPFFEFTTAYSGFIVSQRERGRYVRPFTTTTLEILFMNHDDTQHTFSQIVQTEGFRNVAYAIRHSTVVPQSRKGRGGKPAVDIRYGLGQQLARKAAYPAEFLSELTEFLHVYNAENAQLREKGRNPFRRNVTTADIDAVTALVDRFGSKVVCNMLVAYGYAREPFEERGAPEPADVTDELAPTETAADGGEDE